MVAADIELTAPEQVLDTLGNERMALFILAPGAFLLNTQYTDLAREIVVASD